MPEHASLCVGHQRSFVANPDRGTVAVTHPVFLRYRRLVELVLSVEDANAIVGVDLPSPKTGILDPLLGREAKYCPGAGANVVPPPVNPHVGHENDRRQLVDEAAGFELGRHRASAIVSGVPIRRTGRARRTHALTGIGSPQRKLSPPQGDGRSSDRSADLSEPGQRHEQSQSAAPPTVFRYLREARAMIDREHSG
jgi:hypothetical protein